MPNDKPNAVVRGWNTITVDAMIKVGIPILGAIVVGAMAWQSFADDIDDLEDAGSTIHRRIGDVEEKQEEYNEKLHAIDMQFQATGHAIERIENSIERIEDAVVGE